MDKLVRRLMFYIVTIIGFMFFLTPLVCNATISVVQGYTSISTGASYSYSSSGTNKMLMIYFSQSNPGGGVSLWVSCSGTDSESATLYPGNTASCSPGQSMYIRCNAAPNSGTCYMTVFDVNAAALQGPKGVTGNTGLTGPQGSKGVTGDIGAQGPKGEIGNTGMQGFKGETGDTGLPGECVCSKNILKTSLVNTTINFSRLDFANSFVTSYGNLTKIQILSLPTHGILKLSGTAVTVNQEIVAGSLDSLNFIPDASWNGNTSFSWKGSNGTTYATNVASVNITISAVLDTPTVSAISKSGTEDTTLTFTATDFINHFADPNASSLTKIQIISLPAHGILKLSGTTVIINQEIVAADLHNLTFVPAENWSGNDTFNWNGSNGTVYATNAASVNISINTSSNAPVVTDISKSGTPNTSLSFSIDDFLASFVAADNGGLTKIKIITLPNYGKLKLFGADVSLNQEIVVTDLDYLDYIPPENGWIGNTRFMWQGKDNVRYSNNTAKVNIIIAIPTSDTAWPSWATATVASVGGTAALICGGFLSYKYCHSSKKTATSSGITEMGSI